MPETTTAANVPLRIGAKRIHFNRRRGRCQTICGAARIFGRRRDPRVKNFLTKIKTRADGVAFSFSVCYNQAMLYFTAEYKDAKELLALGAAFDFARWQWRVEHYADYAKFSRFLRGNVVTRQPVRILQTSFACPYCGKRGKAYAVAIGAYTQDFGQKLYGAGEINILYGFEKAEGELKEVLCRLGVEKRFSPPDGYERLINGCRRCGKAFPDDYLFGETDSPFFIDSAEKAENIKVYVHNREGDACLNGMVKWSFPESVLSRCVSEII